MATIAPSKSVSKQPMLDSTIDTERYISSKDFFSLLRKEVDKYYESL